MGPWAWLAIVVVVLAVVAVTVVAAERRRRRTSELREKFGPEYDRAVGSAGGQREAEGRLTERAERREALQVVPLAESARMRYAEQWRAVQEDFVDRPGEAVAAAETLVARVLNDRGYPVSSFESFEDQADVVSVDHPGVVADYRTAHEIGERHAAGQASTEDLREAMLRFRRLFDELLRPESEPGTVADADPSAPAPSYDTHDPKHRADGAPHEIDLTADGAASPHHSSSERSHRHVEVVRQGARVGGEQVDRLGGVDARPSADGDEGVPRAVLARVGDGELQARVGRFDVRRVEDDGLDPEPAHLVGDALRRPGGGDARVGDDEDPPRPDQTQVVPDLVGGAGTELQLGRAVGEHALGRRRHRQGGSRHRGSFRRVLPGLSHPGAAPATRSHSDGCGPRSRGDACGARRFSGASAQPAASP